VKKIRFRPNVPAEIRAIDQPAAMQVLGTLHLYAEAGEGNVKPLNGEFEGLLRLRVGNYRLFFEETADEVIVHRVRDRKEAYRR
jgi:mRNA interferase RelE/StbE